MKECKNAKHYKGICPPKCDGGKGCDACRAIFQSLCHHPVDYLVVGKSVGEPIKCGRCGLVMEATNELILNKLTELAQIVDYLSEDLQSLERKTND